MEEKRKGEKHNMGDKNCARTCGERLFQKNLGKNLYPEREKEGLQQKKKTKRNPDSSIKTL